MSETENYPEIIYKYRDWNTQNHKDVLCKNHLYLASPKDFNDPFDFRIPINFKLLDTQEKRMKFINREIENSYFKFPDEETKTIKKLEIEERLKNNIEEFQRDHEKILFDFNDKHYGVLSLSQRWNSIQMWSHYADHHKGYCVGFWEEKFRNARIGIIGPVYVNPNNDYPQIDPLDDDVQKTLIQTQTKAKDWEYEKEYRLTKIFKVEPTVLERTIKIPDDLFAEIIIGLETPLNDRNEIIKIGRQKGIKIYEVIKVPLRFQINRREII